jgi:hypothetical protein
VGEILFALGGAAGEVDRYPGTWPDRRGRTDRPGVAIEISARISVEVVIDIGGEEGAWFRAARRDDG